MEEKVVLNVVHIVTIKSKSELFKGDEPASFIEKIELEENGFSLVSQKGLYSVGDKAVYIEPDYNLSDIELFDSFIRPDGNPKKSLLGSKNRIRAKKFNFHSGDFEPIYSVGILLPLSLVSEYVAKNKLKGKSLTEQLGITKWEEPEPTNGGRQNGGRPFPSNMYKTDEENINNRWGKMVFPSRYIGSLKSDGSSTTIFHKNGKSGICSRNMEIPAFINKVVGRKNPTLFDKLLLFFGFKVDLLKRELVENDDKFILLCKPYLEKLEAYCIETKQNLALRGEANGQAWKGSGNKNNPDAKNQPNIKFFGVDNFDGRTVKLGEAEFSKILVDLEVPRCEVIFDKVFNDKEELVKECEEYFKHNLVEGIVIRNEFSTFSAKYMSLEYDSKK